MEALLKELKENLVYDLNEYDPSVGLYPVSDLKDWADENFDDIQGVELISADTDLVVFSCEGYKFEIFENVHQTGEDEWESYWDIRPYEEKEIA